MMRFTWTVLLLLPIILIARDNPFASADVSVSKSTKSPLSVKEKVVPTSSQVDSQFISKINPQDQENKAKYRSKKIKIYPKRNLGKKEVLNFSKARFVFRENSAYIETKDKIIRHFSIANPPSIVIDFRGASDFASQRKFLSTKPFTKLSMGAHGKRYRVVLRLDKMHKYKIDKRKYGQVVTIIK